MEPPPRAADRRQREQHEDQSRGVATRAGWLTNLLVLFPGLSCVPHRCKSPTKIFFQSFFMLTTVQPAFLASS